MPKRSSVHIVDRFIEQRLRTAVPGGALPSVRRVMDACRVGPQTVTEAVRSFEQRRLIEVRPQHGLFRAVEAYDVPEVQRIDVLYLNASADVREMVGGKRETDGSFHGELIEALRSVADHRGRSLQLHVPAEDEDDAALIERISADVHSRACITVGLTEISLVRSFAAAQLSVVHLFPASFQLPPNSITTDADGVVSKQMDHLYALGHRRIAYLHNVEDHHPHREILLRREAFYRQAVARGVSLRPGYVAFAGFTAAQQKEAMQAVLAGDEPPTAVICADQHLPVVYACAAARGLTIGHDLSVVGTDDKPIAREVDPPATTLQIRRRAAAEAAFDLLEQVTHGRNVPAADAIYAELKMICRNSTGPAAQRLVTR